MLSITNSGDTIPEEMIEKLFEPFVRANDRGKGLGLGLFIVSQIATAHGGNMAVTSAAGETTFALSIPVTQGTIPVTQG